MDNWKRDIEQMLELGMKYCFVPDREGKYPQLDEEELFGTAEDAGYLDKFISLVGDLRKKAFYSGFIEGARAAAKDNNLEFDESISKFGASDSWELLLEKERSDV